VKEKIIKEMRSPFGLIFMDLEMPGKDGVETAQEIFSLYEQGG
jgi:CheY-like chemotaxis protein